MGKGWGTIPVATSTGGGKFKVTNHKVATFPGWAAESGVQAVAGDFTGDGKCDISVLGHKGWKSALMAKNIGATTKPTPVPKPPAKKPMAFIGCFKDKSNRDLPVHKKNGSKASCASQCKNYKYFGRQYTEECWCGNSYGKYGKDTGCKCDASNIGGWKNCVYSV